MHFSTGQISKLLSREKSAGIYTRTRRNIFHSVHISHHPSLRDVLPWDWQREGGREGEERRLGLSFSSRLLSSRLFKKGGKRERERERNTSTVKKNHTRDMIVVRQRALNQVGFMRRRSGPGGERGRTLAETRSFEGDYHHFGRGGKCRRGRARP